MRELKPEEIKNAPWWANSYDIQAQSGEPIFYAGKDGGAMPIPNEEFEAIRNSFITCNSDGKGHYNVTLETTTLKEAQAVHREILKLRLR